MIYYLSNAMNGSMTWGIQAPTYEHHFFIDIQKDLESIIEIVIWSMYVIICLLEIWEYIIQTSTQLLFTTGVQFEAIVCCQSI